MPTLSLDDFSGGDWGRVGPDRAAKNQFSGTNMLVYRTGELGVRPGVRDVTPPGVTSGSVTGIWSPQASNVVLYSQGTSVRKFTLGDRTSSVSTLGGSFAATVADQIAIDDTTSTSYLATDNTTGLYSATSTTLTQLTNSFSAQAIALYGDRLVAVPRSGAANVLRFSAAADFNSWPATNAITVGDGTAITALYVQRGHLVILKQSQVYVLTGVPGVNETLRLMGRINGPREQHEGAKTYDLERVWFRSASVSVPAMFDGSRVKVEDDYPFPPATSSAATSMVTLRADDYNGLVAITDASAALSTANCVWLHEGGRWTKHTFGVGITFRATSMPHPFPQEGTADGDQIRYGSTVVFCDSGVSAAPTFWAWNPFMDRPGFEVDPLAAIEAGAGSCERAGDASDTQVEGDFETFYIRDPGNEIIIKGVTVHFRDWNTGGTANNHIDLNVRCIREYEGAYRDSETLSWDSPGAQSTLAGTLRRVNFSTGDQGFGTAAQLRFTNLRGVAIRRIDLDFERRPLRG